VRPTSAIESLRVQVRQIEGRRRRATTVLPFGIAAVDSRLPGGGLSAGALHEVAGGGNGAIDGAAAALFTAASPRAHEERCSGVSLDPICSRQPSRKPA
jgi:protein ImuA